MPLIATHCFIFFKFIFAFNARRVSIHVHRADRFLIDPYIVVDVDRP